MQIQIPNDWTPRPYQLAPLQAFERGQRRQMHIWHRRAGKDTLGLNLTAIQTQVEIGTYWHLFPEQAQAKKAIWHGINEHGIKILDQVFPRAIRETTRNQEMQIELKSGSIWQMAGSDRYNSLVGSNVKGCIFSEWALCDPAAWDYIRPILRENDGWAIFITTLRGKNHAHRMYERMKHLDTWYCSKLTVDDTTRHDGTPVLTPEDIQAEREEGMSEGMIEQEYYCSANAAHGGAYYAKPMRAMDKSGRIAPFTYDPNLPLHATFDLGFSDHLAGIFIQPNGNEHHIIGSKSWQFTTLQDVFHDIKETFPWGKRITQAIIPPDINTQHIQVEGVELLTAPKMSVAAGIDVVKNYLAMIRIDNAVREWEGAEDGNNLSLQDALCGYRTEHKKGSPDVFQKSPAHTWESHYADSLRYYCVYVQEVGFDTGWSRDPDYSLQDKAVI